MFCVPVSELSSFSEMLTGKPDANVVMPATDQPPASIVAGRDVAWNARSNGNFTS